MLVLKFQLKNLHLYQKNKLFHFLFLKIYHHDYRTTILENTFRWLFSERFVSEKVLILGKILVTTFFLISAGHIIRSILRL